jgi:hypothetical protein
MSRMLTRTEFAPLIGSTYSNVDNLTRAGQLAFAFGLAAPAVMGKYHRQDVFANALAAALAERGFPRGTAVGIVREHDEAWLGALTAAEWSVHVFDPKWEIYFAVGRAAPRGAHRVAAGLSDAALEELRKAGPVTDIVLINIHSLVDAVYEAFYQAGLGELANQVRNPFTRPAGHTEFQAWREDIARHCQQSIDRVKAGARVRRAVSRSKRAKATA